MPLQKFSLRPAFDWVERSKSARNAPTLPCGRWIQSRKCTRPDDDKLGAKQRHQSCHRMYVLGLAATDHTEVSSIFSSSSCLFFVGQRKSVDVDGFHCHGMAVEPLLRSTLYLSITINSVRD